MSRAQHHNSFTITGTRIFFLNPGRKQSHHPSNTIRATQNTNRPQQQQKSIATSKITSKSSLTSPPHSLKQEQTTTTVTTATAFTALPTPQLPPYYINTDNYHHTTTPNIFNMTTTEPSSAPPLPLLPSLNTPTTTTTFLSNRTKTLHFSTNLPRHCQYAPIISNNASIMTLPSALRMEQIHSQHTTIEVFLKRGIQLARRDLNGYSDPYCKISVQQQQQQQRKEEKKLTTRGFFSAVLASSIMLNQRNQNQNNNHENNSNSSQVIQVASANAMTTSNKRMDAYSVVNNQQQQQQQTNDVNTNNSNENNHIMKSEKNETIGDDNNLSTISSPSSLDNNSSPPIIQFPASSSSLSSSSASPSSVTSPLLPSFSSLSSLSSSFYSPFSLNQTTMNNSSHSSSASAASSAVSSSAAAVHSSSHNMNASASQLKSHTVKRSLNPEWNEVFEFSVECDQNGNVLDELRIECWDQDKIKRDDFLGQCTVDLSGLTREKVTSIRVQLDGIETGEIELEIIAHGFGKGSSESRSKAPKPILEPSNPTPLPVQPLTSTTTATTPRQAVVNSPVVPPQTTSSAVLSGRDRYDKTKRIGEGLEGKIFLGVDKVTNRRVAIKKLICANEDELQKANREALPITKLNHAHIVKYDDIYVENGSDGSIGICFVMKYFEKGDLRRYLRMRKEHNKKATFERVVKFSLQMAEAVKYLHANRIMHRDLKPENILMSNDYNSVHIGDFGFKRQMEHSSANTVLGSLGFLAPEVAGQQKYSWKADIYSLGCVMYEIATLDIGVNHNFQALHKRDEYFKGIEAAVYNSYHSRSLANLIQKMLQISPVDRPTAEQVVSQLRRILEEPTPTQ